MTKTFEIADNGNLMGEYKGADEDAAVDAYASDAGYDDFADLLANVPGASRDEVEVFEIDDDKLIAAVEAKAGEAVFQDSYRTKLAQLGGARWVRAKIDQEMEMNAQQLANVIIGTHVPDESNYSIVDVVVKDSPREIDSPGFVDLCESQIDEGYDEGYHAPPGLYAAARAAFADDSTRASAIEIVRETCRQALAEQADGDGD
jgi:hypothetical protein